MNLLNKKTKMDKFLSQFEIIRFVIAIFVAFLVTFIILAIFSDNALQGIIHILSGPLTSVRRFSTVIESAIPLTFAGLAITVMFRANQFNLAAEGAIFMGGLVAALVAIFVGTPPIVTTVLAIVCGGLVGSLVTLFPGFLKVKWDTSVLVVSIMFNTVIQYLGNYIFNRVMRDPNSAYASSHTFQPGTTLPILIPKTRLHAGLIIVLIFVVLVTIFLNRTKWGYKISLTGSNLQFARNIGINTAGIILLSQIVGGFIGGVGGAVEMLGLYTRFQWTRLPGFGFDGVVLNIIARDDPKKIPLAAFLVAYIRIGAEYMYRQTNIAAEIVAIIEGTLIILIAAEGFLSGWRQKRIVQISTLESGKE